MSGGVLTVRGTDLMIEQAIARLETNERIMRTLGVSESTVNGRRAYLDELNKHVDHDPAPSVVRVNQHGPLAACGTKAARARHRGRGERCEACAPVPVEVKPCGTEAAYRRHQRRGERCLNCRTAAALARAERQEKP